MTQLSVGYLYVLKEIIDLDPYIEDLMALSLYISWILVTHLQGKSHNCLSKWV